jgi:hypothetical protein
MMTPEERKPISEFIYGNDKDFEKKFDEQEKCIQALPLVKLSMEAFVEGEDEVVVGDILTCKLRVECYNL